MTGRPLSQLIKTSLVVTKKKVLSLFLFCICSLIKLLGWMIYASLVKLCIYISVLLVFSVKAVLLCYERENLTWNLSSSEHIRMIKGRVELDTGMKKVKRSETVQNKKVSISVSCSDETSLMCLRNQKMYSSVHVHSQCLYIWVNRN